MTHFQLLLVGVIGMTMAARLVPRWLTRFRVARAIRRGLSDSPKHERVVDMQRVSTYYDALTGAAATDADTPAVDDATWADLDLDAMFASLDRTTSHVGRQYLYRVLRTPRFASTPLVNFERMIQQFAADPERARLTQLALQRLATPHAAHVVSLLFGDLPARPPYWPLFPFLSVASVLCLALMVVWPASIVMWMGVCFVNIGLQLLYRPRVRPLIAAFQAVPALVDTAAALAALDPHGINAETAVLRRATAELAPLRLTTSWLLFEAGTANEVIASLYEYVNMLFLFDLNAFAFSTQRVTSAQPLVRALYEAVGRLDAAQSVAAWRADLVRWTQPHFLAPGKRLLATDLYHPLLAEPVANSIQLEESSALVTGSNMAGKTTFMRTLGVNAILAQTLNTTCSSEWNAPFLSVRSSIRRADSLLEGKSHYLAEVESVRTLVMAKRETRQHLFILDEMFRGTNTAERVAAAFAVLSYLNRGNDLVTVATHDVELLSLLGDGFDVYHFRESVSDDSLAFDFLLRRGAASTRNAIALLKLMRYPEAIVSDALSVLRHGEVA